MCAISRSPWSTRTRSPESRELVDGFLSSGYFHLVARPERAGRRAELFARGTARLVLVVPPGFAADLGAGRTATVQVLLDGSDANTATIALGYAEGVAAAFGQRVLLHGERLTLPLTAHSRVWYNETLASRDMIVPGLVAVIMMVIAAMLTSLTIAREWERGTMEQLASTPVTRIEVVLGKLLPYLAIGLVDVAAVYGARRRAFRRAVPRQRAAALPALVPLPLRQSRPRSLHLRRLALAGARHADRARRHLPAGLPALGLHVRDREHAAGAAGDLLSSCRHATSWW